jgi:error-prone DNA polymerase
VAVRGVDVNASQWDCTLERSAGDAPAVRLGLRLVKGLPLSSAQRLIAARRAPFAGINDLAHRTGLRRGDIKRLADAGALAVLTAHRRQAHWHASGVEDTALPLFEHARLDETPPWLPPPTEGEDLIADYASLGFTLGRHPLDLLRGRLRRLGLSSVAEINALPHRRPARAGGLVINRQRPSTAKGVMFFTLEDETGQVNVVVWPAVAERQRRTALESRLLGVYGRLERRGIIVHLIAQRLMDLSPLLGILPTRSRDFR